MAGPASAAPSVEPVTETLEMPVLNLNVVADVSSAVTQSADNAKAAALEGELTAQEQTAEKSAAADAKKAKDKAEATAKAEAERKAQADSARKAAAERASRTVTRGSLEDNGSKSVDNGDTSNSQVGARSKSTGSAAAIVAFARAQVGKAYVSGGTGPSSYDCSGLVQAAYRQVGVDLPRISQDQSRAGTSVSLSNLQPGDILYWGSKGSAYHVAIYVGGGNFVGAQNSRTGIVERSLDYDRPTGAVRVL
jgi:cell wall-associated NlpC family hydrolase